MSPIQESPAGLSCIGAESQFLLLPIEDASELRTVANLRQDRALAERRAEERREAEAGDSRRFYEVDPVMTAGASVEDVETEAQAIMNGERSYRLR